MYRIDVSTALAIIIITFASVTPLVIQMSWCVCWFGLHPWNAWNTNNFLFFVSLFLSIILCKDSWEDFTELVEQMQMLDEFKGAYSGITPPFTSISSGIIWKPCKLAIETWSNQSVATFPLLCTATVKPEFSLAVSVLLVCSLSLCLLSFPLVI